MLLKIGDWMTSLGLLAFAVIAIVWLVRDEIAYRKFKKETEESLKKLFENYRRPKD
jgi:hypothetical protein